jgi:putative acetyltransferase
LNETKGQLSVIQNDASQNNGLNVAALGMMTVEDVVIEPMNLDDKTAVTHMVRRGIGSYEEAGTVLASTFRRLDNFQPTYNEPGSTFIVARDKRLGGLIIGGAGIGPLHGLSPLEGLGEIRDLVVLPEWRGNGIGARLLKRCLEESKRFGYQRLYLETTPQMEQARKLFIRYGFRPVTTGLQKVAPSEVMPCYYILESLT